MIQSALQLLEHCESVVIVGNNSGFRKSRFSRMLKQRQNECRPWKLGQDRYMPFRLDGSWQRSTVQWRFDGVLPRRNRWQ